MFLWPLFRIASFFMVAPVSGAQFVPARVRLGISLLITVAVIPLLPQLPQLDPLSPLSILLIGQQVLIGVAIGFTMQLFFHVFVMGGQMMAMQMALGMASLVDPANGVSVTVVAQFFLMLVTVVFVATNGHLLMIEVLIESFKFMPVGFTGMSESGFIYMVQIGSWMFLSGFLLALPAVTALLVVNIAFGVMTRAAPQLNIFSLGFPVSMVFGLFIIWLSLLDFLPKYDGVATQAFALLRGLLQA